MKLDDIERRLGALTGKVIPLQAKPNPTAIVKEAEKPRGWRFVPLRDGDNLIVEIIATPIE